MKGLLIALAATLALTHAAPQGGVEFTAREYQAFQQALGDRIPVAIQSAIRILASSETNPTDFVVLNFNGLSGATARAGVAATTGTAAAAPAPAATGGVAISARTGSIPTDDDVAEIFSEVANDAVEDVQDAADDAADEADLDEEEVNRNSIADNTVDQFDVTEAVPEAIPEAVPVATDAAEGAAATQTSLNLTPVGLAEETSNESPAVKGAEESPIAKSLVQNSLDNGAIDIIDPTDTSVEVQADDAAAAVTTLVAEENTVANVTDTAAETPAEVATKTEVQEAAVSPTGVEENTVADVTDAAAETPAEVPTETEVQEAAVSPTGLAAEAEDEVDAVVANEVTPAQLVGAIESARRKRQDVNLNRNAQELGLGLSALGGFSGGHVGRYLDDIFGATVRLINNFESTGNLVLDQVDRMLERPKEKTKRSVSFFNRK